MVFVQRHKYMHIYLWTALRIVKEGFVVFVQRYEYMHIYLWTALRIVVFERGLYGF